MADHCGDAPAAGETDRTGLGAYGDSRRDLLKRALFAGGAVLAGGTLAGGLPRLARSAQSPAQDVQILNFLLELEYLQAAFYAQAAREGGLSGELVEFALVVGGHEREHVAVLREILGDEAAEEPTFEFGDATADPQSFARSALLLEETGTAAYIGQGANLTKEVVATAAGIVAVEARHTAWVRDMLGVNPAPRAADPARTPEQVRATIRDAGFAASP